MRWFAGWYRAGTEADPPPVPPGARQVWPGGPLLWVVGQWAEWEIRTAQIPGCQVAAFGACLATDTELAAAVTAVGGSANYVVPTKLPGNHVTVVYDKYGVTIVTDLAGLHPVFYTPWSGGTLFASSPLSLADLTQAGPDLGAPALATFSPLARTGYGSTRSRCPSAAPSSIREHKRCAPLWSPQCNDGPVSGRQ